MLHHMKHIWSFPDYMTQHQHHIIFPWLCYITWNTFDPSLITWHTSASHYPSMTTLHHIKHIWSFPDYMTQYQHHIMLPWPYYITWNTFDPSLITWLNISITLSFHDHVTSHETHLILPWLHDSHQHHIIFPWPRYITWNTFDPSLITWLTSASHYPSMTTLHHMKHIWSFPDYMIHISIRLSFHGHVTSHETHLILSWLLDSTSASHYLSMIMLHHMKHIWSFPDYMTHISITLSFHDHVTSHQAHLILPWLHDSISASHYLSMTTLHHMKHIKILPWLHDSTSASHYPSMTMLHHMKHIWSFPDYMTQYQHHIIFPWPRYITWNTLRSFPDYMTQHQHHIILPWPCYITWNTFDPSLITWLNINITLSFHDHVISHQTHLILPWLLDATSAILYHCLIAWHYIKHIWSLPGNVTPDQLHLILPLLTFATSATHGPSKITWHHINHIWFFAACFTPQ